MVIIRAAHHPVWLRTKSMENTQKALSLPRYIIYPLIAAGLIGLGITAYFVLPDPVDWAIFYRPATLALLAGKSPFTVGSYFNPPWILLPLIPFALLPYKISNAALFVANLVIFIFIGRRSSKRPLPLLALLCSFPVIVCLLFGQIDGIALLGLFMPRPLGMIFLLAKPQTGAFVALFWVLEAWRQGKWKQVFVTVAPVGIMTLASILIFHLTPQNFDVSILISAPHNTSLWPGSILIGLPLLVYALRQRKQGFAMMATPLLSPYIAPQSWSIGMLGLIPYEWELVAASLASWVFLIERVIKVPG
jgi:hypothetical protein